MVVSVAAVADAAASVAAVDASTAGDDDAMAFAVALTASIATASEVPSSSTAAPLAVASRLDTCCQGMGAAGISVHRPRVLNPCQGFPQFIRLNVCHHPKHFFLNIKNRGNAIQDSTVNFLFSRTDAILFQFHHSGCRSGDIVPDGLFLYLEC